MIRIVCIISLLLLCGCSSLGFSRQQYVITGTMNGQPVELEVGGETQTKIVTKPDPETVRAVAVESGKAAGQAAAEIVKAAIPGAAQVAEAVKVMLPAPQPSGFDGATGGALGAAGGLGLLALREYLNARQHKRDADEGWDRAERNAKAMPPPPRDDAQGHG
jgi:hypothetical protein